MKVQVQELSPIEKSLSIEVDPGVVAKELDQAYATLGRQVKIAGFRPGKVPRRILEQRFKAEVEDDVIRRVVAKSYVEAVKQNNIEAVADPHVTNGKIDLTQPFAFTARVEVKPQVTVKDYKGLALKKNEAAVTDATIDERIEAIRQNLSTVEKVEGRDTAKAGDFCVIDYTATIDGKDFAGGTAKDTMVEVAQGDIIHAKIAQLEGAKVGESREVEFKFPDDQRDDVKGKTAKFTVTLKDIREKKLPEIDDALAEKSGAGVHTLKELRERIKKDLERAHKRKADDDERQALIQGLIEKNNFDVPRSMVERAMDMMLEGAFNMLARSGMDPNRVNIDWAKMREDFRSKAETEVRGQLLFEAVSKQENIEIADEDVEKKLEAIAEETGSPLSQVRKAYKEPQNGDGLKARIREEKTIAFLRSNATYS